jgi:thiamine pyrophosphate-dependent acetolactate synthase large subunit-like protein
LQSRPGICTTVSALGFLNGMVALANATTNCFPTILISGAPEGMVGCVALPPPYEFTMGLDENLS